MKGIDYSTGGMSTNDLNPGDDPCPQCAEKDREISLLTAAVQAKSLEAKELLIKLQIARDALNWYADAAQTTAMEYDQGKHAKKALEKIGE